MKKQQNHCKSNGLSNGNHCKNHGKSNENHCKPLPEQWKALRNHLFCHCSGNGLQWFFTVFSMVLQWFPLLIPLFLQWFCCFFIGFPMFSLPFPWFAMVFIVFSMVLLWSSLIFGDFAMVFTALSSVSNGFPCFSIKSYENQHSADFSMGGEVPRELPPPIEKSPECWFS